MRAIYYPFYQSDVEKENLVVSDEQARHLLVVRIRQGEAILVLNGRGLKAHATVNSITKNTVELIVGEVETVKKPHDIHLAIANPKKDAFEDILKIAVEMGVVTIQPLSSAFSQYDYEANERFNRILESALIQSNNAFLPVILPQKTLEQFLESQKTPLYFFNSRPTQNSGLNVPKGEKTVLIGPEGGFSLQESELLMKLSNVYSIHMSTPIQRAPTAVASSISYLLAKCD